MNNGDKKKVKEYQETILKDYLNNKDKKKRQDKKLQDNHKTLTELISMVAINQILVVILISYVLSDGVETPLKDGEVLSASGSKWVGTGIRTFYILAAVAISLMLFSGVSKIIKK